MASRPADDFDDRDRFSQLARDLSECLGELPQVPGAADAAMERHIRRHFERRLRRGPWWARAGAGAGAVAAAVLLVVAVGLVVRHAVRTPSPPTSPDSPSVRVSGDVDHNGTVDILDAYALARLIQSGRAAAPGDHDVNGDGVIDANDVEVIAMAAVSLTGEEEQG